ncbi:hypothetical protein [Methanocaldococcus jannaschii]|uniref:hypothetical protein n=1 Tax=Methanocaldococcus jannaschii TaxID=2190 RepID=UPI000B0ECC43|nr:hypothetical protein [Methanocaldococcus jannaschii]
MDILTMIVIGLILFTIFVLWLSYEFIKSAVKSGIKEGIRESETRFFKSSKD